MSTSGNATITRNVIGRKFLLSSHRDTVLDNSFHHYAAKLWNEINYTVTANYLKYLPQKYSST